MMNSGLGMRWAAVNKKQDLANRLTLLTDYWLLITSHRIV
jgi:hypothetical protein